MGKICHVYVDDIVIFSKDEKSHLQDVKQIFAALESANMKI